MYRQSVDFYIKSKPYPVFMAGFESTTLKLQQQGWQLAFEKLQDVDGSRLAIYHPNANLYGVSDVVSFYEHQLLYDIKLVFYIRSLTTDVVFHQQEAPMFMPIDARPEIEHLSNTFKLSDLHPFKTIMDSEEIIVDPSDVPELMEKILKAQEPKQQEIRQRLRKENERRDLRQSNKLHAQIISLVG